MRLIKFDTIHPIEYLKQKKENSRRQIEKYSFEEYLNWLIHLRSNYSDFFTYNLKRYGWEGLEFITNDFELIRKAIDHINPAEAPCYLQENEALKLQSIRDFIKDYKPDVIIVREQTGIASSFWNQFRDDSLIIGVMSCPMPRPWYVGDYDVLITSSHIFRDFFQASGIPSYLIGNGFDERILKEITTDGAVHDVVFVGGLGSPMFTKRTQLMEYLSQNIDLKWWGYGVEGLNDASRLNNTWQGHASGLDMFSILSRAHIVLNDYVREAKGLAVNQRLYEVMGIGSFMLTRHSPNLTQDFPPGLFATFHSKHDCLDKIKYFLKYENERKEIAKAGQEYLLKHYSYRKIMGELHQIIIKEFEKKFRKKLWNCDSASRFDLSSENRKANTDLVKANNSKRKNNSDPFKAPDDFYVTAVISTFNSERFIRGCLEDLEGQTIADKIEIIVVDSGSRQNENRVVKEFQQRYDNIVYLRSQERETIYAAWNRGVKAAAGKYITNANTDDRHRPDALEKLTAALEAYPDADLAYSHSALTAHIHESFDEFKAYKNAYYPPYNPALSMLYCLLGPHPVWRRSVFDKIGLFNPDFKAAGDYEFQMRFTAAGLKAVLVPEILSLFYQNPRGLSLATDVSPKEAGVIWDTYRKTIPIETLYQIDPKSPTEQAKAWVAQGNLAFHFQVPWEDAPRSDYSYAFNCYRQALELDPSLHAAIHNLILTMATIGKWPNYEPFRDALTISQVKNIQTCIRSHRPQDALVNVNIAPAFEPRIYKVHQSTLGVDIRTLQNPDSVVRGIGQYTYFHLLHVVEAKPHWLFEFYGDDRPNTPELQKLLELPNTRFKKLAEISHDQIDLLHIPDPFTLQLKPWFETPLGSFPSQKTTITFYDLIPLRYYADGLSNSRLQAYNSRLSHLKENQYTVLAISEYSKKDLCREIPDQAARIATIMAGVNFAVKKSKIQPDQVKAIKQKYGISKSFFLHVGSLEPHKNFETVLDCWLQSYRKYPTQLVVVGYKNESVWAYEDICCQRKIKDIFFTGFITRSELHVLYRQALALLCLSKFEGFGLPVLEAMANAAPVIASNSTSIPEVAGHAALIYAPSDTEGIVKAMLSLITGPELRKKMVNMGLDQASRFSWKKTAEKSIRIWQQLFKNRSTPDKSPYRNREIPVAAITRGHNNIEPLGHSHDRQIKWAEGIFSFSGYSRLSRDTLLALDRRGISLELEPFSKDKQFVDHLKNNPNAFPIWQKLLSRQVKGGCYVCFHPPTLWDGNDWYARCRDNNRGFDKYIGITMFETDRMPTGWPEACNAMDEIWVPSTFNRQTFVEAGVDRQKLHVIPFGLNPAAYDPEKTAPLTIQKRRGFTFLSVFQWSKRKGWDILLQAYLSAFSCNDDVCLVLRTYPDRVKNPPLNERITAYIRQLGLNPANTPPIILLEDFIPESNMPNLYAAADAFVLPTRGEGWGIPYMEAMAMGLPVIGTRWGASLDFMNDANSYLIDVDNLVPVDSHQTVANPFYGPDHHWAEPSVKHTAALMRQLYENQNAAKAKGKQAYRDVHHKWDIERTADWIINRVSYPASFHKPKRRANQTSRLNTRAVSCAPSVSWHAPIYDPSGYADEARNFLINLDSHGVHVCARAIGRYSKTFRSQMEDQRQQLLDQLQTRQPGSDFISVVHFPAYAFERIPAASYHIGRTMFETNGLPPEWVEKCNQMDEIWVPTEFNLNTFRRAGVTAKLFKVPAGIDTQKYRPGYTPLPIPGLRGTVFLSIFEWIYRKGWDVLLRAWRRAFAADDNVSLLIRSYPMNLTEGLDEKQEMEARINNFLRTEMGVERNAVAPIVVWGQQIPEVDMPRLYAAANALVAPSRGEGWGRPQMEAMACGLPVIATRWSGNLEFMHDQNSYLIDIEGLAAIDDRTEISFYRGQNWAEPSVEHLSTLLRKIVEQPHARNLIGHRARIDMKTNFQWPKAASIAADRLRKIGSSPVKTIANNSHKSKIPLRWEGSQFVYHSLALVNRELCIELAQHEDVELSIVPYEPHQFTAKEYPQRLGLIENRLNKTLAGPAKFHIRHQWPPNFTAPAQGHWIIMQPWEYGALPLNWIEPLKSEVDEIWVYTNYVRDVYINSGIPASKIQVISLGVNYNEFHCGAPKLKLNTEKQFKFLFVGGTLWRKGIDVLLEAYARAFGPGDDVCLVIKDVGTESFYKGKGASEQISGFIARNDTPEIIYYSENLKCSQIAGLYTACDCLVHPYRGEGFGLPVAEAMACGLPVVVTKGGACDDFCNRQNAYLIASRRRSMQLAHFQLVQQGWVLEPDKNELVAALRSIFENSKAAAAKGRMAARDIRNTISWKASAAAMVERLRVLGQKPIARFENRNKATLSASVKKLHTPPEFSSPAAAKIKPKNNSYARQKSNNIINYDHNPTLQQGGIELKSFEQMYQEVRPLIENEWYEAAISAFEKIVAAYPEKAIAYQELGALYYKLGQIENALFSYQQATQLEPENIDAQKNLADFYYAEMGQSAEALKIYEIILAAAPDDVQTLLLSGHIHVSLNRFDAAAERYRHVLEVEPWNADARQFLEALEKQGAGAGAQTAESMYQEIEPTLYGGQPAAAIQALEKLSAAFPNFALAHNDLGVLYYHQCKMDKAQAHYEQATRLEPGNVTFKKNLADFYYVEQGRVADALKIYVDLLAINPQDIEILQITGHICVNLNKFEDAAVFYNRILEIEPWNFEAKAYLDKLPTRSLESMERKTPADVYQEIQSRMKDSDPQTVIDALEKLSASAPDFAPAHNDLGVLYYQSGAKEKALNHYEQAARLEPGKVTYKKNLADFYYVEQGRVEDALKIYVDLLAINPTDIETLQITGHICVALHKFEDAKVFYNRVLEIEPWNIDARDYLEKLQLKQRAV